MTLAELRKAKGVDLAYWFNYIRKRIDECKAEGYPFQIEYESTPDQYASWLPVTKQVFKDSGNDVDVFGSAKHITSDGFIRTIAQFFLELEQEMKHHKPVNYFNVEVHIKNNQEYDCKFSIWGAFNVTVEYNKQELLKYV